MPIPMVFDVFNHAMTRKRQSFVRVLLFARARTTAAAMTAACMTFWPPTDMFIHRIRLLARSLVCAKTFVCFLPYAEEAVDNASSPESASEYARLERDPLRLLCR